MTSFKIVAHGPSRGARRLSQATGWPRIKKDGSEYPGPQANTVLLNWGNSGVDDILRITYPWINFPTHVKMVTNKRNFFRMMREEGLSHIIPPFTVSKEEALHWLYDGHTVVVRHKLTGHSGAGIEIVTPSHPLPDAPLYVLYMPKKWEFRVHILDGQVIDVQQKKRKKDVPDEEVNWAVRNRSGGFIYARENLEVPPRVFEVANAAMHATPLDFGAIDVLWNGANQRATVLEINTAPGLQGTTVTKYAEAFKKFVTKFG